MNDDDVYAQFQEAGPPWAGQHASGITHGGLKALGVGSNQKKLERAARLAIVVTALCLTDHTRIPDPTGDAALRQLVEHARLELCKAG